MEAPEQADIYDAFTKGMEVCGVCGPSETFHTSYFRH